MNNFKRLLEVDEAPKEVDQDDLDQASSDPEEITQELDTWDPTIGIPIIVKGKTTKIPPVVITADTHTLSKSLEVLKQLGRNSVLGGKHIPRKKGLTNVKKNRNRFELSFNGDVIAISKEERLIKRFESDVIGWFNTIGIGGKAIVFDVDKSLGTSVKIINSPKLMQYSPPLINVIDPDNF